MSNGNRIVNVSTKNGDLSIAALSDYGYVVGTQEQLSQLEDLLSDDLNKVELEFNPNEATFDSSRKSAEERAERTMLGKATLGDKAINEIGALIVDGATEATKAVPYVGKPLHVATKLSVAALRVEEDKRTIARIKDKANERSVYAEDQKAIAEDAPAFLPGGRWSREAEFDRDLAETAAANEVTGPRGADVDQENNDNDSRNPGNTGPGGTGGTGRDGGGRTGDPGDRPGSDRGV